MSLENQKIFQYLSNEQSLHSKKTDESCTISLCYFLLHRVIYNHYDQLVFQNCEIDEQHNFLSQKV